MNDKIEIERKFVIKKPSFDAIRSMDEYTESEITQIYLSSESGVTHRIRRRVYADRSVCTETKKIRIDTMSAYEDESEISESEFKKKAEQIDVRTRPILKKRYTFGYKGHTVEIDVYPEWERCAIMEIELASRNAEAEIPPFIEIKKEVTGEREYSNAAMSRVFPSEPV